MKLFDFSLLVGTDPHSPSEGTREALLAYLDSADAGGLVASLSDAYYDFAAGNRETIEIARGDARLLPAFAADPRRIEAAEVDFEAARKQGFRALVLFPDIQGWGLSHPAVDGLAARAAAAGLPVVVHLPRNGPVGVVAGLAARIETPLVACGLSYACVGEIVAAAAGVENLLFGMRILAGLDNVEALAARLGPERLVFDSGEPLRSHAPAFEVLQTALISGQAREMIAVGNARRIFGGAISGCK